MAAEDQPDLVGAADAQVVQDHLLEEQPPGDGPVEHLGQGELGLQDRDLIAVPSVAVGVGERVGQDRQPLVQQGVDLIGSEPVADLLQPGRVLDRGERVVQRGEPDPDLSRLVLCPVVAVDAQLRVVGEVGAELDEERVEVLINGVEVNG